MMSVLSVDAADTCAYTHIQSDKVLHHIGLQWQPTKSANVILTEVPSTLYLCIRVANIQILQ